MVGLHLARAGSGVLASALEAFPRQAMFRNGKRPTTNSHAKLRTSILEQSLLSSQEARKSGEGGGPEGISDTVRDSQALWWWEGAGTLCFEARNVRGLGR